jgi:hypothetical protein
MSEIFDYAVFGLSVRSNISLPELFSIEATSEPDVTLRTAPLTDPETPPGLHIAGDALMLNIPNVARYRIEGGREIVIDPDPSAPERNVRLFLLGSAFGALLHQRGLLPLHANAIQVDGKAVAFMGESGSGKSTLAAWFHDRGFRVMADDVCVVRFGVEGGVWACPGLPRLRLWEEVLEATGRQASEYPQSYLGDSEFRKFDVSINSNAAREASEICAIFILSKGESFAIERLGGVEAAHAVFENTYRGAYLDEIEGHHKHWTAAIYLVRKVPIFRLSRVWDIGSLEEQCELILESARRHAAS